MGELPVGCTTTFALRLENKSDGAVTFDDYEASCGCVSASGLMRKLDANTSTKVRVTIKVPDQAGRGSQSLEFTFRTGGKIHHLNVQIDFRAVELVDLILPSSQWRPDTDTDNEQTFAFQCRLSQPAKQAKVAIHDLKVDLLQSRFGFELRETSTKSRDTRDFQIVLPASAMTSWKFVPGAMHLRFWKPGSRQMLDEKSIPVVDATGRKGLSSFNPSR